MQLVPFNIIINLISNIYMRDDVYNLLTLIWSWLSWQLIRSCPLITKPWGVILGGQLRNACQYKLIRTTWYHHQLTSTNQISPSNDAENAATDKGDDSYSLSNTPGGLTCTNGPPDSPVNTTHSMSYWLESKQTAIVVSCYAMCQYYSIIIRK